MGDGSNDGSILPLSRIALTTSLVRGDIRSKNYEMRATYFAWPSTAANQIFSHTQIETYDLAHLMQCTNASSFLFMQLLGFAQTNNSVQLHTHPCGQTPPATIISLSLYSDPLCTTSNSTQVTVDIDMTFARYLSPTVAINGKSYTSFTFVCYQPW